MTMSKKVVTLPTAEDFRKHAEVRVETNLRLNAGGDDHRHWRSVQEQVAEDFDCLEAVTNVMDFYEMVNYIPGFVGVQFDNFNGEVKVAFK